ncbi:hypothetical protein CTheo_8283 [Ceratobasidium theobromae]|uniref:A-kinase anchor protein 7-like phosphoesterase domain-containing protein n=1 Tax=Ceratobasidium theobromae TaxID=1582974 RepID=A0A5N5Q931_9AGAM|nr:hypothetical protein CTheo_8283 [Ceratobasidium theobromae]
MAETTQANSNIDSNARGRYRKPRGGAKRQRGGRGSAPRGRPQKGNDRPTHFISVPLDHIKAFTSQISNLTDELLAVSPPITGLDSSIVISPARLHLTLGVMNLAPDEDQSEGHKSSRAQGPSTGNETPPPDWSEPPKTISQAVGLLQSLKPEIEEILSNQPLQLNLDELTVMRRSEEGNADVMYIGPAAGVVRTEEHSQSLHCTILNTSHRKPPSRNGGQRVPFSMAQIEEAIARNPQVTGTLLTGSAPLAVRELNICRMGSYDPRGRYVRVGGIEW